MSNQEVFLKASNRYIEDCKNAGVPIVRVASYRERHYPSNRLELHDAHGNVVATYTLVRRNGQYHSLRLRHLVSEYERTANLKRAKSDVEDKESRLGPDHWRTIAAQQELAKLTAGEGEVLP